MICLLHPERENNIYHTVITAIRFITEDIHGLCSCHHNMKNKISCYWGQNAEKCMAITVICRKSRLPLKVCSLQSCRRITQCYDLSPKMRQSATWGRRRVGSWPIFPPSLSSSAWNMKPGPLQPSPVPRAPSFSCASGAQTYPAAPGSIRPKPLLTFWQETLWPNFHQPPAPSFYPLHPLHAGLDLVSLKFWGGVLFLKTYFHCMKFFQISDKFCFWIILVEKKHQLPFWPGGGRSWP